MSFCSIALVGTELFPSALSDVDESIVLSFSNILCCRYRFVSVELFDEMLFFFSFAA